jgi:predicted RNA-binding Zn-ribbon protein involved in translation (DUF1610 family)
VEQPGDRFVDGMSLLLWQDPVLVVCPTCHRRAVVRATGRRSARLVCPSCGLARTWEGTELHVLIDDERIILKRGPSAWVHPTTRRGVDDCTLEQGVEPRFGLPLWLRTECCGGNLLWANNEAHLDYLAAYVGARLRERRPFPTPLSAKLPKWLKSAKHRDEVLRHIDRLRSTLSDA